MTPTNPQVLFSREDELTLHRRSGSQLLDIGVSTTISEAYVTDYASAVAIQLPAISAGTVTFQVQANPDAAFVALYDNLGANVVTIASSTGSRAVKVNELAGYYAFKCVMAAQAANRTILVNCWDT